MNGTSVEISGDKDVVMIFDSSSGSRQILLPADAQVLLDRLIEFQHKEGSTDVSLSEHRGLTVVSTTDDLRFSFFYRSQGPETWITLNQQKTQLVIGELRKLLKRPGAN